MYPAITDTEVMQADFDSKIEAFRSDWYSFYKSISKEKTPEYDGSGKKIVERRPDGLDYVIEAFMKDRLNYYFPGWSWVRTCPPHFLGAEWVTHDGELLVIDARLLAYGINPPYRKFAASGAARIQFKRDMPHTPENLVDLDKNVKASNTNAFKKAINQMLGIADDIYGKRIEDEGMGNLEEVMIAKNDVSMLNQYLKANGILPSKAMQKLGVKSLTEVTNIKEAIERLKER